MTDSVRESAQEPQATQAPRRNVAAKTSLATDLSLIAVFAGFIARRQLGRRCGSLHLPDPRHLHHRTGARRQACHRLRGAVPTGWFRWPAHLR